MSVVLDASFTLAWLFIDEENAAADAVMMRVAVEGAVVPAHWRLEIANTFRSAVRRGRCDEDFATESLVLLDRLAIRIDDETNYHAWTTTRTLSRDEGLTLYDAAYLELALRTGLPLATCDSDLIAAGTRRLTEVLSA